MAKKRKKPKSLINIMCDCGSNTIGTANYGLMYRYSTDNPFGSNYGLLATGLPTAAPENVVAPVISGATYIGKTLSCTEGNWTNSPTSYSYQWYSGATPIGTDSSTYVVEEAYEGTSITCAVTATNGIGSSDPETSNALHHFIPSDLSTTTIRTQVDYLHESTLTISSGKVQQIDDLIGSADYANATPATQPLEDDTNKQVLFDTEGQYIEYAGTMPTGYADVIFVVCKPTVDVDETSSNQCLWHCDGRGRMTLGNATGSLTDEVIAMQDDGFTSRVGVDKNAYPTLSSSTKHCIIGYYTGDTIPWGIRVDGSDNLANIQAGTLGRFRVDTGGPLGLGAELQAVPFHTFNGGITEACHFDGTGITDDDLDKLASYAYHKHGTPIDPSNPYIVNPPDAP